MIWFLFLLAAIWILLTLGLSSVVAPCGGVDAVGSGISFWFQTRISCLQANELGDYLAGMFAPAAFLLLLAQIAFQMREARRAQEAVLKSRYDDQLLSLLDELADQLASSFSVVNHQKEQGWVLKDLKGDASSLDIFEAICAAIKKDAATPSLERVMANHKQAAATLADQLFRIAAFEERVSERFRSLLSRANPRNCVTLLRERLPVRP
ncbi:hypothetical protein SAMN05880582_101665 [Rhizobium sp. RU20A]|uniref:hypothetical protein n=1 Tax=Rhizobium sp. RU20A TaxID=1907412 RepID=UPI00095442FF|nr:hypothetical protein [Rhizobium sp. RU20A]SIQ08447.1 hypothetical protein SAMN05880582_101665 [Rhizobium sp. RU20A]